MEQLAWLPVHANLGEAIRAARLEEDPARRHVTAAALAGYRRDFIATRKIDNLSSTAPAGGIRPAGYEENPAVRLAILSSHTVDHLIPAIRVAGLCRRFTISTYLAEYGLYRQVLLGSDALLARFEPHFVLLALDAHDCRVDLAIGASEAEVSAAIDARITDLRRLWRQVRERYGAQVIQQTLIRTVPPVFGSFESRVPGAPSTLIEGLNTAIRTAAREEGTLLLDLAWLWQWFPREGAVGDPVRWHQAKQLVSPAVAPLYGDLVARIIAAAVGRSRKCLVLDLDNTLWGGVIGDDGLGGIHLGQGDALGEAFVAFQNYVATLGKRGIALAVCSKNDPVIAEAAFANHPEMILSREDIACFVANWDDKASNLRRITNALNLGLDTLVFVDDNPAERDLIRRELPAVAVPELPEDAANYAERLAEAGYFEAIAFTSDDAIRSQTYRANVLRQSVQQNATDMGSYLQSLSMTLVASPINATDLVRAAQLINKSNQFNLTTRRYSETELGKLMVDPESLAMCFRLRDRFGDNGLISVVIARRDPDGSKNALFIDTWLMSCRVLGRQVEAAVLQVMVREAARRGIRSLIGEYKPTSRNGLVADHYSKLGFSRIETPNADDRSTFWRFDIEASSLSPHFIRLETVQ